MRYLLCLAVLMLAACHEGSEPVQVHRAEAAAAMTDRSSFHDTSDSPPSYQVKLRGTGEDGEHEKLVDIHAPYQLPAFDGELMGDDRGEWGGELMFRDHQGLLHMVLGTNVHGIKRMPFGVVVFTGLAHMRSNVGALYLVSQAKDGTVEAAPFRPLAGAPTEVMRTIAGDLVFKVYTDRLEKKGDHREPALDCYRLTKVGDVSPLPCSSIAIVD